MHMLGRLQCVMRVWGVLACLGGGCCSLHADHVQEEVCLTQGANLGLWQQIDPIMQGLVGGAWARVNRSMHVVPIVTVQSTPALACFAAMACTCWSAVAPCGQLCCVRRRHLLQRMSFFVCVWGGGGG